MFPIANRESVRARKSRMTLVLAAGAAVSVSLFAQHANAQFTWTGAATGPFSNNANWLNGLGPPQHGSNTMLFFSPGNISAGVNATNDQGGANQTFNVNAMTFNNMSVANNCLIGNNNSSSNVFEFDPGAMPATITMQGYGLSQTSSGIAGAQMRLTTDLRIVGAGMGNLTFNNPIFEDGTPRKITVANTPATPLTGIFTLASPGTVGSPTLITTGNTFSGDLVLDGGSLGWSGGGPGEFGTGRVVVTSNGGELFMNGNNSSAGARFTTMRLDGNLRVVGTSSGAMNLVTPTGESPVPTLTGSGNLTISGQTANTFNIGTDSSAYTGVVTIDRFDVGMATGTSGGMQLLDTNGNLRGVSTFNVRNGGILSPVNSVSGQAANSDRIANTATVNLASGTLRLIGTGSASSAQTNVTEVVGTINGSGFSTLTAESATGATKSTTINAENLSRADRGTFLFRGTGLTSTGLAVGAANGDGTLNFDGAANTGYIVVPASTAVDLVGGDGSLGTNRKILPYAAGDTTATGAGSTFVTLDSIGGKFAVHPLAASEYATTLTGDATNNVQLTTATANADPVTVNSLVLTNSGANHGSITGSGTITVTSGAVMAADANTAASISNNIAFGPAEGHVYTPGFGGLTITGNLTGAGGLTKSGGGSSNNTLFLRGDNSGLTGPLTINAGVIDFNSANALPGTGQIVTNGAGVGTTGVAAGLFYSGTTPYTLSRDLAANSGWMTIKALDATTPGGANLTITGQISGNAGMNYQATPNGADIYISPTGGVNTYTGPTRLAAGNIHFASDAALGAAGGEMSIEGATAVLEGDWTTSRIINNGGATINTNGHNAVLNGPMINFNSSLAAFTNAALTKTGLGSLTLNSNANSLGGPITVSAGSLIINGTIPGSANAVTVAANALLGGSGQVWRNITISSGGTLSPGTGAGILTENGNLTISSGANFAVDLLGPAAGVGYDQMAVSRANVAVADASSNVTVNGANLSVTLGYQPSPSDLFFILTKDGTTPVSGTFAGLAEGATVSLGMFNGSPYTAQISYLGNSATNSLTGGNDVVLYNAVPTPGALALLGIGGLLAARRRRAR
jgi:autotransporter-associated beta strand protein